VKFGVKLFVVIIELKKKSNICKINSLVKEIKMTM